MPIFIFSAVIKATPEEMKPIAIPSSASIVIVLFIKLKKKNARNLFYNSLKESILILNTN